MVEEKKGLRITWTQTAEEQFLLVLVYWTEKNKSSRYAEKLAEMVWERMVFLSKNPFTSVATKFPGLRRASLGPFSIYYKINIEVHELLIMAFWDNRQDPKKLLKLLLKK